MPDPVILPVEHPERVNLTFATDIHDAALPPGRRRGTYSQEIQDKLVWWAGITTQLRGAALCGGDVFHVKPPTSRSNALGFVTDRVMVYGAFPHGRVFGSVGNHDLTGDNQGTLPDQPLGNLIAAGVYHSLDYQSVVFASPGGCRVRVDGITYSTPEQMLQQILATKYEEDELQLDQMSQEDRPWHYRFAVIHAFNQQGKSGPIYGDWAFGWDDLVGSAYDVFLWGHDHSRKGIHQVGDQWHVQLGSLSRAALSSDEIDRPVSLAVISTTLAGITIREKEVPVKPLELSFHTASVAIEKADKRADVAQFMSDLEEHASAVDSEDPLEILATLTDDLEIVATIKEVCELG